MVAIATFWSASGGPEVPALALSVAALMNRDKIMAAVVDGDFESPAFPVLAEKTARNIYDLLLWASPAGLGDIIKLSIDGATVPVMPVVAESLAELVARVNVAWGVGFSDRGYIRKRLRYVLDTVKAAVGVKTVLLVARSGLAVPSQDMIVAADTVVVVSRPDPLSLARTDVALREIAGEMEWGKSVAVWLQRVVPVVVMADPLKPGEAAAELRKLIVERLASRLRVAVDAPLEAPLIPSMIGADPRDYARLALNPPRTEGPERGYANTVHQLARWLGSLASGG